MSYYIIEEGQQKGPFSLEELALKNITASTDVWTQGMANWTKAGQVEELKFLITQTQVANTPPAYNPQPEAPAYNPQPEAPAYNSQPEAPAYNSQPEAPAYNSQPEAPAYNPSAVAAPAAHVNEPVVSQEVTSRKNTPGLVGFICGLASLTFCFIPLLGIAAGVVGLIFSIKGKRIPYLTAFPKIGFITSIIGLAISAIINTAYLFSL